MATAAVNPLVTVAINYDVGKELSDPLARCRRVSADTSPNGWFALTPRYELFNDRDGWALIGQPVQEFTLTARVQAQGSAADARRVSGRLHAGSRSS